MSINCSVSLRLLHMFSRMASLKLEFSRPHIIYSLRAWLKELKNDAEHNCGHRLLNWAVNSKCS